ncbi:permease [Paenibacillus sp. HWE-109]|uniref:permease n=1 Tax=Paenibacillus sp. HWE-109 TaxID=1306526 RepID=UPI001EDD88B7|nr:permease [Paenibacillus sp. HWE-109]UKS24093.1 permease [Paenibacillus sp. HWE-109]
MSFLSDFRTMVIGILLESFPFILLGVIISALLQTFISDQALQRWIPKKTIPGILFGCLLGIIFPLCECGIIPVVHRLIRKGMPPYIGIVFMMAGPVINPVVFTSTFVAFRAQPQMAVSRMVLAFAAAALIGVWAARGVRDSALRNPVNNGLEPVASGKKSVKRPLSNKAPKASWTKKWHETLEHAAIEMFDVGKFLVLGATVTALLQTAVSRQWLLSLSDGDWTPHLFMMGLAYVLSICSTADAFVGATFIPDFSLGSVLAFLVFGAMLDIKSTLMLLKVFRLKTVLTVMLISAVVVLLGSVAFDRLYTYL